MTRPLYRPAAGPATTAARPGGVTALLLSANAAAARLARLVPAAAQEQHCRRGCWISIQAVATTTSSNASATPWSERKYGEVPHDPLSTFRSGSLGGFGQNVSDAALRCRLNSGVLLAGSARRRLWP